MLPNFKYIFILLAVVCRASQAEITTSAKNATSGRDISDSNVRVAPENRAEDGDMWSMVASMRQVGGDRVEASSSTFSKSLKLEWAVDLDTKGHFRLSWCVNVSRNEILFALDLGAWTPGTNFRIGTDMFALGFSERGQLASSDFCLIWYDLSHKLHLQDARTNANNILELIEPSPMSACKLLSHHRSTRRNEHNSPLLKVEVDYVDDDDAKLDLEEGEEVLNRKRRHTTKKSSQTHGENLEIIFTRPLEVCPTKASHYYAIDNGTTHLVWFTLRGPLLELDGLNLTEALSTPASDQRELTGMRRVQMIATRSAPSQNSGSLMDVRMQSYPIPAQETTYMCKIFRLPAKFERRRFHMTSYEALIEPGNEHIVHHMELFNCANLNHAEQVELEQLAESPAPQSGDSPPNSLAGGWAGPCDSKARPMATQKCKRVILAWAMGARPLVYPAEVGQSIGGRGYSPFLMLEVHYNNVNKQARLLDSSGLRFHYSAQLRPFDAGVLEVGLEYTDKNSIPPRLVTPLAGHCLGECTRTAMAATAAAAASSSSDEREERQELEEEENQEEDVHRKRHFQRRHGDHRGRKGRRSRSESGSESNSTTTNRDGIYIFAAQMHTHLVGVASWTEHVRGGQLLGELQRDDHYSPHFQEIRLLPQPVHFAPGDALIHHCLYDTRQRVNVTLGGFATSDEMCVTYLHYYPKIDLEVCKSSVDTRSLSDHFERLARDEAQPTTRLEETVMPLDAGEEDKDEHESNLANSKVAPLSPLKSVGENYRSIDWSVRRSRELIGLYNSAPLSIQCLRSDGSPWPGAWEGLEQTRFSSIQKHFRGQLDLSETSAVDEDIQVKSLIASSIGKQMRSPVEYRGFGARRKRASCPHERPWTSFSSSQTGS